MIRCTQKEDPLDPSERFGEVKDGIGRYSALFFGRWGRRRPLLVAIVLQAAAGLATAFVPWLSAFMALRFLVAVATGGTMVISFVICE